MNNPLVCICIPHYNNQETIADTLDSILKQTYKNIIIKVFDNASTDQSIKILQEYEAKYKNIQLFINEKNIGGEANFTKCIEGLEGDFGAIYHADDIYHPSIVETQVKYLLNNDISALFVRASLIDEDSKDIGDAFFPAELKNEEYVQCDFKKLFSLILKYDNFLITPSVMARVEIYKNQIKSWNGSKFKTSADLDVWLRFAEIKDIGIITKKLIAYRVSTASFSYRTKFSRIVPRDMFLVIDYYLEKYKDVQFSKDDYEFLKFKDNLLVIGNKILNNKYVDSNDISICNKKLLIPIMRDKQKAKIYVYGIVLKALMILKLKTFSVQLVRYINKI